MSQDPIFELIDKDEFELQQLWAYDFPWAAAGVVIRPGFITNFASIPWAARWVVSPIDPTICKAALVHDYLVGESTGRKGKVITGKGSSYDPNWHQAAEILRGIMAAEGASWWKRTLVYRAVRLYGVLAGKK